MRRRRSPIDFLPESGTPIMTTNTVAANAPLQIHADQVTDAGATSTMVRSLDAVPLAIERTMSWNARGYGGHGGGAVSPATRWLFAEGAQGFLKTYILLANDNAKDVAVTVKFLLEGGGVVTHVVTVPARSRETIDAGSLKGVVNRSFGLDITARSADHRRALDVLLDGHGSHVRRRPRVGWRERDEHALVPRGRGDGAVLRLLRAAEQSERRRRRA